MGLGTLVNSADYYRLATAEEAFTALQLATAQTTEAMPCIGAEAIAFYVENTTDKTVTVTWKAGPESDEVNYTVPPTAGVALTDGSVTPQRTVETLTDPHAFVALTITPTGVPTIGVGGVTIKAVHRKRGNLA